MTSRNLSHADERGHQLAMHLRGAYARLRRRSNMVFSAFGMTSDQYVLLTVLTEKGEATQQQLAELCYSDTATIGTMVSLLENKRLVTRVPHHKDGRAWSVRLTSAGLHRAARMRRSSTELRCDLSALFTGPELRTFLDYLGRLADALSPAQRIALPMAARVGLRQPSVRSRRHSSREDAIQTRVAARRRPRTAS